MIGVKERWQQLAGSLIERGEDCGIKEHILVDLKEAMKLKDEMRLSVLRMLLSDIKNEEVSGSERRELADDEVISVLRRAIKRRKEAAEQFRKGGREEMAEKEEKEIECIEKYLPPSLSDDELKVIIQGAITELGANSIKDMGKVMKFVMDKVSGRADGKAVSEMVKQMLSGAP